MSESSPNSAIVRVLGIRHHGPGSARGVSRALDHLQPDCVLIEGPAELTDVVSLASSDDLAPPVAGFVYLDDSPRFAVFDPFAIFSPEWVAMQHGVRTNVPVRFIDLPASHELVERAKAAEEAEAALADYLANPPEPNQPELNQPEPTDELADTSPLDDAAVDETDDETDDETETPEWLRMNRNSLSLLGYDEIRLEPWPRLRAMTTAKPGGMTSWSIRAATNRLTSPMCLRHSPC